MLGPVSRSFIAATASLALFVAFGLGPLRRAYASPARVVAVASPAEAYDLWEQSGVRGRVGLVFASDFVPAAYGLTESERAAAAPKVGAIERAMHHALLREVHCVIPDARWPAISFGLGHVSIYRRDGPGLLGTFEDGRVHVVPLGALWPSQGEALLLIDAGAWSPADLEVIAGMIASGAVRSDLIALMNGRAGDLERLAAAQRVAR
jgi:hypothetical protein